MSSAFCFLLDRRVRKLHDYVVLLAIAFLISAPVTARPLNVARSEIAFEAESRMANARGVFRQWSFEGDVSAEHSKGQIRLNVCSLDTANAMRDNHLRGPDFLDCVRFPEAVFQIQSIARQGAFHVQGLLTLKGSSRPVHCQAEESSGVISGHCFIDRRDFGISYQSALNPISHNVKIVFTLRTD